MSDLIPSSYVRVKYVTPNGKKKSIYLEQVKYPESQGIKFVSGYEVDKNGDPKKPPKGIDSVLNLIQLGEGVEVIPQLQSKTYGDLHDA